MSSSSYSGSVSKSLSKISSLPANLTIFQATFICQCIVCMRIGGDDADAVDKSERFDDEDDCGGGVFDDEDGYGGGSVDEED